MTEPEPESDSPSCFLCGSSKDDKVSFGELLKNATVAAHYFCLLLAPGLSQNGEDDEGLVGFLETDILAERKRIIRQSCHFCKKRQANLSCCNKKCKKSFHIGCGLENECQFHFSDDFSSYCRTHIVMFRQKPHAASEKCSICYEEMGTYSPVTSINGVCCKKGWYHRHCLAYFAQTAGYFFKCPLCLDKEQFIAGVVHRGVFVPERDAQWELEPNAFAELLERPNNCTADECRCEQGRDHLEDPDWLFIYCRTCGSQGMHEKCFEAYEGLNYFCAFCTEIGGDKVNIVDSSDEEYEEEQRHKRIVARKAVVVLSDVRRCHHVTANWRKNDWIRLEIEREMLPPPPLLYTPPARPSTSKLADPMPSPPVLTPYGTPSRPENVRKRKLEISPNGQRLITTFINAWVEAEGGRKDELEIAFSPKEGKIPGPPKKRRRKIALLSGQKRIDSFFSKI